MDMVYLRLTLSGRFLIWRETLINKILHKNMISSKLNMIGAA